ncbi:MAG TPA: tannase/feruloyl esterase family alpha/beta hydrolase [Steroidobacteraceae bacterium]|nr:tannase/feruloyl esterase family alpha/beta hydrolase [Steroidobacteraceae bacterium]
MKSLLSGALLAASVLSSALAAEPMSCNTVDLQKKAPAGTTILAATTIAAKDKTPAHCFVKANVATPGNMVDFQLALPANWNGKFLFQGVGGFAGSMARLDGSLGRGYAAATTDTGHQGKSGTDGSWALDHRPKELDYGHRGTHVSAVAAKQLTSSFFGAKPKYSYFNGCSNGGRQALMEAQRYPDDFDGIVAGDPSFGAMGYVRRALMYQFILESPDRVLPAAKLDVVSKAVVAACDGNDGVVDGLVGDPRHCKVDLAALACKGADSTDCLTKGQLESVAMIHGDSKLPNGDVINGFPVGHESGNSGWPLWLSGRALPTKQPDGKLWFTEEASPTGFRFADGFFRYMAFEQDDPNFDWRSFDLQRDLPRMKTIAEILSPTDANLNKFGASGKKLLLYHGWADPAISAYGTIAYYDKVVKTAGGKQKADDFVRLFMAPGMHHCRGGPGPDDFDTLAALEQWVEKGVAPDKLIASHSTNGKVDRTRPLCPEPQVARYKGSGSIDAAENFTCAAPPK